MTDILEFPPELTRPVASEGTAAWALRCACNVSRAIDRRMPEASVLTSWLNTYAAGLGLPESSLPADDPSERSRRSGVADGDWGKVRRALDLATVRQGEPDTLDRWVAAFERRLALDAQETLILTLALRYVIDDCMEQLYDDIARSRCRPTHFTAESRLIALLLAIPQADIETRLTAGARLFSSGLLSGCARSPKPTLRETSPRETDGWLDYALLNGWPNPATRCCSSTKPKTSSSRTSAASAKPAQAHAFSCIDCSKASPCP